MINFDFKTSPEIEALDNRARRKEITIPDYCRDLDKLGVDQIEHMLYVHRAFGLSLGEAKRICIELEYGSIDTYADEMCEVIDQIANEMRQRDNSK
jgi:hypothetical protein